MATSTGIRVSRIAFGSSLILATMSVSSAPLGGFAILPLIAIPLILSGIYAENPLGELMEKPLSSMKQHFATYVAKLLKPSAV